jgi:RNA polymerase sigma-70 factor, ECF subfamily
MKDEESIIKRAREGDEKAFGKLYDEYLPRIYRFIFLKVGRKQDTEDLTHQVFVNAWQNVGRYEFRGFPFSSWLYRIANNAVIDYYRTWKNLQNIDTVPEERFADNPETDETVDTKINMELLKGALAKLETDQQNVLIMKFIDDLSNKEIATALEKSEGAVRVIQHRALKQLKKYVDGIEPYSTTEEA